MKAMAQEEADGLRAQLAKLEGELEILLLPRDPLDERSIMLEVCTVYFPPYQVAQNKSAWEAQTCSTRT